MTIQLQIYLERAGLIEESKKTEEQKLKDFLRWLNTHEDDNEDEESAAAAKKAAEAAKEA